MNSVTKSSFLLVFLSAASASGSPAGKQKGIHDFFSVTGVIRTSPQKSAQPCSSTCTNGLNGEVFPRGKPNVAEEEEDDDDTDDDVSLLAAVRPPDPDEEEEEEEIDDFTLLAAEKMLRQTETDKKEVDYLEGMTAEMFGHDDEFDNQEEVEPLPDEHYGLLGSSRVLLQPQGCIDDLPEEVLRQVLCLLPARDLYLNVSCVCHRWRNIVKDTKVKHTTEFYQVILAAMAEGSKRDVCFC